MAFQKQVQMYPAVGIEGAFASLNPYASYIALEGALIASENGATIGRFAWVNGNKVSNKGTTAPAGFVTRNGNFAVITQWLGESTMVIPEGVNVTLHTRGDFWAETSTVATVGQKIFASTTDGSICTGAAGATITGFIETNFSAASSCAAGELVIISAYL